MKGYGFSRLFIAVLLITAPLFVSAQVPRTYPKATGFVTDMINLLKPEEQQSLENFLFNFEKETGNEIAILILDSTLPETIEQYSIHITDQWKVGKKGLENGVLFTIAIQDRSMRLEVGRGLEGVLTDLTSTKLLDNLARPRFREGDFYEGIKKVVEAMAQIAKGEFNFDSIETSATENNLSSLLAILIFVVPFILSFFASFFARSKEIYAGGITGAVSGGVISAITEMQIVWIFTTIIGAAIVGLIFDKIVSSGKPEGRFRGGGFWGGFGGGSGGGGSGGGGFGGFGGGSFSGGGGTSRW